MLNLAVIKGECAAPPEVRVLESGTRLGTFSLRVRRDGQRAMSLPVAVWDPPAWLPGLDAGDDVLVVGEVHRRFFRAGGPTPAVRVEVVADSVTPGADRRRVGAAVRRAHRALDSLSGP